MVPEWDADMAGCRQKREKGMLGEEKAHTVIETRLANKKKQALP